MPRQNNRIQSILIVEDNDLLLDILSSTFQMYGMDVFTAENGINGLYQFDEKRTDVVLTDIGMDGLNGAELASHIRNRSPQTKIAVMSSAHVDVGNELLKNGTADYFFVKPFALSYACRVLAEPQKDKSM